MEKRVLLIIEPVQHLREQNPILARALIIASPGDTLVVDKPCIRRVQDSKATPLCLEADDIVTATHQRSLVVSPDLVEQVRLTSWQAPSNEVTFR